MSCFHRTLKKPLYCVLLLIGCVFLINATTPASFKIVGIKGFLLINVENRLKELYENKIITQQSPESIQNQVAQALYPYGYFKSEINVVPGNQTVIQITTGPRIRITRLNVKIKGEGVNNAEITQAVRDLPIKIGQPLNNNHYEEAKTMLFSSAEHQGYLQAFFEKSELFIDRQAYITNITLIFNTGPQFYFGQVRFDPTYISPDLLHRFVPFQYGQPYSTDNVLNLNNQLSASGYFKSVVVKPDIGNISHVPIDIHLERIKRINYSLGLGYGTDTGPRGRAGMHIVPVNRSGHKFNAVMQGSLKQNALLAQYIIPGRNPVTDNFSFNGSFTNLNYDTGNSNAVLFSAAQQHNVANYQRSFSINALNERYNYTGGNKTTKTLVYPKASFTWRQVSAPLFSPSGYNITANGLVASKALLSNVSVAQATLDIKAAITVDPIRTRLFFHSIQGATSVNTINNLPLSLAMLLGGAENLKGYGFNSIGPGKILTYGGLEIQKETFDKWYFIGFADTGDVYNPDNRLLQHDAGIALMWVSPVGPIKLGVAQAIDNRFHRIKSRGPKLVINMGPDL